VPKATDISQAEIDKFKMWFQLK